MGSLLKFLALAGLISQINASAYFVKLHHSGDENACTILTQETIKNFRGFRDGNDLQIRSKPSVNLPAHSGDDSDVFDKSKIIEIYGKSQSAVQAHIESICSTTRNVQPPKFGLRAPEIVQIVNNGDKSNRIDVVFMGDGYTLEERDKFFDDMTRLTQDMFEGVTFKSWLPVFNIWAIFVESVESGIGYNGPKNTPFQLYRQAGQLRGIFPGNPSYARQVCALTGTSGCDYPSLIANDDYYGGLGGEFVISTKSARTGTVVLRHEMGHNFIYVGEEYDDGGVYRGVNSASSLASLGWTSWLSGPLREERMIYRLLQYPWHDLSTGPRTFNFLSDGSYSHWYFQVSVTAAGEEDSLEFEMDGVILPWASRGSDDREFYDWYGDSGFSSGQHTLTIRSKTPSTNPDIPRMIASLTIHEYGNENEFNPSPDHVSAYPTWDTNRRKTFRPTNEACSMRNMTSPLFCPVCKEGMWMQFLERISLIDAVEVSLTNVTVHTLKLGQLREPNQQIPGEHLEVRWFRDNVEQVAFRNQFNIDATPGSWRVQVQFITPEIRYDPEFLTLAEEEFSV